MRRRSPDLKQLDIFLNRAGRRAIRVLDSMLWLRGSKVSAVRRQEHRDPPPAVSFRRTSQGLAPPLP
jgi:transposase InsO family protein